MRIVGLDIPAADLVPATVVTNLCPVTFPAASTPAGGPVRFGTSGAALIGLARACQADPDIDTRRNRAQGRDKPDASALSLVRRHDPVPESARLP